VSSVATGFGRDGIPRPPLTLTFDLFTLKLVCESHLWWEPSFQIWARKAFGLSNYSLVRDGQTDGGTDKSNAYCSLSYVRDGQTDGGTDKSNAYCSLSYARGIIMEFGIKSIIPNETATNG